MEFWTCSTIEKFQLKLDDTHIPIVNKIKFLGVMSNDKLKWTEHINNVIFKILTNKNLIGGA